MNGNPNKKQRDWHEWLRDFGCTECLGYQAAIHHIIGSKMKLKGCVKPGEWYVIPLCYEHHQGPEGVHLSKKYYDEKKMWVHLVGIYESENAEKPMSEEEYQIILDRG